MGSSFFVDWHWDAVYCRSRTLETPRDKGQRTRLVRDVEGSADKQTE